MAELHLDTKAFTSKPLNGQTLNNLHKRICKTVEDVAPKELAELLANGHTMVLGVMKNQVRKKVNLNYQEVIALDFDADTTIEEIENNEFIKSNASFIYTTFSHTEENHRFRVVFFLEDKLTNNAQVLEVYNKLFNMFPTADISCKDSSRLFFGGTSYKEINFENTMDAKSFVELPESSPIAERQEQLELAVDNVKPVKNNKPEDIPTYKLIRIGKKETDEKVAQAKQMANDAEVKRRWKQYGFDSTDTGGAMVDIKKMDMRELLGLPTSGNFHDIFTVDNNPSANIQKAKNSDIYLYFRASSDPSKQFTGDIIKVVQKLRGCNFMTALHYIIDMMGITFGQSEDVRRIKEKVDIFTATLTAGDLKESYPNMYHTFERYGYGADIERLLNIISRSIVEKNGKLTILSQFSTRELSQRMYHTPDKEEKVRKLINLLSLTDFVKKLQDHEIDEKLLSKLEEYKDKKGNPYRKNLVSIEEYDDDFLEHGERKCGELKQFKFTIRESLTREWVLRHLGEKKANEMYPQDTKRTISKQNQKIYDLCVGFAVEEIQSKGFVTEEDVVRKISRTKKIKITQARFKWKQLRSELCEAYGLEITPLNKELKKEFQVSTKYGTQRPNVLKFVS